MVQPQLTLAGPYEVPVHAIAHGCTYIQTLDEMRLTRPTLASYGMIILVIPSSLAPRASSDAWHKGPPKRQPRP